MSTLEALMSHRQFIGRGGSNGNACESTFRPKKGDDRSMLNEMRLPYVASTPEQHLLDLSDVTMDKPSPLHSTHI